MGNLTKEQRNQRDQLSARAAVRMANDNGLTAAIAVDDIKTVKLMLKRVVRIAEDWQLEYDVEQHAIYVDVLIGEGIVRILAADSLVPGGSL